MYVELHDPDQFMDAIRNHLPRDDEHLLLLVAKDSADLVDPVAARLKAEGIRFLGGIFPAMIDGTEVHETGAIVQRFKLLAEPAIAMLDQDTVEWAHPLPPVQEARTPPICLILTDFSCLLIDTVLDELFNRHADDVNYFGAGAGIGVREPNPVIFSHQGRFTGAAVVAYLDVEAKVALRHGWSRFSEPVVATRTDGNVLKELNWEPAMAVYRQIVGDEVADSLRNQRDIPKAKRFPFGISREGLEDVVRDPLVSTGANDLVVLSNVPENSVLHVLEARTDMLIAAAEDLGNDFAAANGHSRCMLFDCFSRAKLLGDEFARELVTFDGALRAKVGAVGIEGVLALGEIASDGNRLPDLHNKTMAAALFNEV